jgi:hypothetical protein
MEHVMRYSFEPGVWAILYGLALCAPANAAVAAPAAHAGKPLVVSAPAQWRGARDSNRDHRGAFAARRSRRFTPAFLAPVVATPQQPSETVVQQSVTAVQQATLPPVYRKTVCSGPMIISIRPAEPKRAVRRSVAPHAGPQVVYGFPLPCPETGGFRRAYYREGVASGAY